MPDVYAEEEDLYRFGGLARGELPNPGRAVAAVHLSSQTLELEGHAFALNTQLTFRAEDGTDLPYPLKPGIAYFAIPTSPATFQVTDVANGAPLKIGNVGGSFVVVAPLPIAELLEFYSRFVDPFIPAHHTPLAPPYPTTIVGIVAQLAAKRLQLLCGEISISMAEVEKAAYAQLQRWASGIPLRDARATRPSNLAVAMTVSDPRGWGTGGLP